MHRPEEKDSLLLTFNASVTRSADRRGACYCRARAGRGLSGSRVVGPDYILLIPNLRRSSVSLAKVAEGRLFLKRTHNSGSDSGMFKIELV